MLSKPYAILNILTSLACTILILISFTLPFYEVTLENGLKFQIYLQSMSFSYPFSILQQSSSFSSTISACSSNQPYFFSEICKYIPSFQTGGRIFLIICLLEIACLLNSAIGV